MATYKSDTVNSQEYTNIANRKTIAKTTKYIQGVYTLLGTEVANDIIELAKLPTQSYVISTASYIKAEAPGTALVVKVGTNLDDDAISTALTLTGGGIKQLASGTNGVEVINPSEKTEEYKLQLKITTATALTAGAKIAFEICYIG